MQWGTPWELKREHYRLMPDDEWRTWFAWYPVRLANDTWAWLEAVEYNQPMRYNIPNYRVMNSAPHAVGVSPKGRAGFALRSEPLGHGAGRLRYPGNR